MPDINQKPKAPDPVLTQLAEYVAHYKVQSREALQTAKYCLLDSIGCALLALRYPACTKLLGPIVPSTQVPKGARVIGTSYVLDPVLAAFNNGLLIRWLDFNDTWLAAEWGHPSDNFGAILSVADFISQQNYLLERAPLTMREVLDAIVKAYEIQGILALENSFNRVGFDHVILVKLASAALTAQLLGGDIDAIIKTLSHVFVDGQALRTYRHAPNTGSRKSWAAGDACSRGVWLAWLVHRGEMGYLSAISAKTWGFSDVSFKSQPLRISRPLGTYVMENILFKIAYPAEFHAQTAVECALKLHPMVKNRLNEIEKIIISTQESAVRIISKEGPLHNPADRDHCLQYMVAIPLLYGELSAEHYEDEIAKDPQIDTLREKMHVLENLEFSKDYLDPNKRSIANALQIFFKDGTSTEKITVEFPIGHVRRREEGTPLLMKKFIKNASLSFNKEKVDHLMTLFDNETTFFNMPVDQFMDLVSGEFSTNR